MFWKMRGISCRQATWSVAAVACAVVLVSTILQQLSAPTTASANVATDFRWITYENDHWANYDGGSSGASVDWPLRFVLFGNAEVDKVKNKLDGCGSDPTIFPNICNATLTGPKDFFTGDRSDHGGQGEWVGADTDSGQKTALGCSWYYHMRVYARSDTDRNYSPDYGFYVFMTVHQDYETWPACYPNKYRSYESTEAHFTWRAQQVSGWISPYTSDYQYNSEIMREWSPNSFVESDGLVTYIYVP